MSQLLFNYLAFVRPFAALLASQVNLYQPALNVPFVFATDTGIPFNTDQLSTIIRKYSEQVYSTTLTVASYRQVVLAIAKQYITTLAQPFNAQHPDHILEIWKDIAMQSAHNIRTLTSSYTLDTNYPAHLQPDLIGRYSALSERWHCWLQLDELEQKQKQKQLQPVPVQTQVQVEAQPISVPRPRPEPNTVPRPDLVQYQDDFYCLSRVQNR